MPIDINALLATIRTPREKSGKQKIQDAVADVLAGIGAGLANRGRRGESRGAGAALQGAQASRTARETTEGAERQQALQNALSVAGLQRGQLQDESTQLEAAMAMRAADLDAAQRRATTRQQRQPIKAQVLGGGQGDQPFAFDPAPPPGPGTMLVPSPNPTGMAPISSFSWGGGGPAAQVSIPPPEGWREEVTVSDFPRQTFENLGITLPAQKGGVVDRLPTRLEKINQELAAERALAGAKAEGTRRGTLGVEALAGAGAFEPKIVSRADGSIVAIHPTTLEVQEVLAKPFKQDLRVAEIGGETPGSRRKVWVDAESGAMLDFNTLAVVEPRTILPSPRDMGGEFSDFQLKNTGFLLRGMKAHGRMVELEDDFINAGTFQQLLVKSTGPYANLLKDPAMRQITLAQLEFVTALIRPESGAAVTEDEFARERVKYFPQVDDTMAEITAKREVRNTAIESLRFISGRLGDVTEIDDGLRKAFVALATDPDGTVDPDNVLKLMQRYGFNVN
jgi:hypothetical protein